MALMVARENKTEARRLQRLAEQGQLRRIAPGIYTDDLVQPLESVSRRELLVLLALTAPGCVVSHRSALDGGKPTVRGNVFLTGRYRRELELPGIKIRIAQGPGPLDTDIRVPTFNGDTYISSQPRALLENLSASRGDPAERRTLGAAGVEAWLEKFISRDVSDATNKLRDSARAIAEPLGLQKEFIKFDAIVGTLLGTRAAKLSAPTAVARASGRPYDDGRVTLFESLANELRENPLQVPPVDANADTYLQAFIETYFSNYIEGTEFELEEAHDIVVNGRPMQYREDDSHDILGTYQAILKSKRDPSIPPSFEAFVAQLQEWNRQVIESRHVKRPGEFKTENNRAGNTVFVKPELVIGTLAKGYEAIMSAASPENRAALAVFVVAEVHPFTDGNGRTARLAMNLFLSNAGLTRIVIPTVYRDDYLSALKAMSNSASPIPLVRMLARAARFGRWVDIRSKESAFSGLKRSNALSRADAAKLEFE